jgi:trans-aconitate methyltransferase
MTPWHEGPISDAARGQQKLWGSDAAGWARFAEPHTRPLFEAVLATTGVTAGTRLLDVGCGSGLLLEIARARGAAVTGLDVAPALLTAARDRVPAAQLWLADLQRLPFPTVRSTRSPA